MSLSKINYSSATNITVTLASLASLAARQCLAVDNSTDLYLDAIVRLEVKLVTGTPGSDKVINVWFYGSQDGTNYGDNATGTDAALTLRSPSNLRGPWVITTPDVGGLTYKTIIPSVAAFFGGNLPPKWGFVVENRTGLAFSATEGDHAKTYKGLYLLTV